MQAGARRALKNVRGNRLDALHRRAIKARDKALGRAEGSPNPFDRNHPLSRRVERLVKMQERQVAAQNQTLASRGRPKAAPAPRKITLKRTTPEHKAAVRKVAGALQAREDANRAVLHANSRGTVEVMREQAVRKFKQAQPALRAARKAVR